MNSLKKLPIWKNETFSFDEIYNWLKNNQFVSFYKDGKKYFFFAMHGRIYWLSEWSLGWILFTIAFFGTVGIRTLFKKYEIPKKVREKLISLIKKLNSKKWVRSLRVRGGGVEEDILHYEIESPATFNDYVPLLSNLNARESLVKGILKKCLRPKRFYKITNRGLLEIIETMIRFKKTDSVRIISYDVLILALWNSLKPMSPLLYQGATKVVEQFGFHFVLIHAPLLFSVVFGISSGFGINLALLNSGILSSSMRILLTYLLALPGWVLSFRIGHSARDLLAIDCTDYFQELPVRDNNSLPYGYGKPLEDVGDNSKIHFTPSQPTRHETFVSTAPGEPLYYENREKELVHIVHTLDGQVKESQQVNGERVIHWKSDFSITKKEVTKPSYIPLADRTATLENVKALDSTIDRESMNRIRDRIRKEQLQCRVINDFIE